MTAPTLWDVPLPPTGPQATIPKPKAGSRDAYWLWRRTADGQAAWDWMAYRAQCQLDRGDQRIAIGLLMAMCRATARLSVDQRYGPYLTDELCERWPAFLGVIERRRRKAQRHGGRP